MFCPICGVEAVDLIEHMMQDHGSSLREALEAVDMNKKTRRRLQHQAFRGNRQARKLLQLLYSQNQFFEQRQPAAIEARKGPRYGPAGKVTHKTMEE